jgi:uncharacterized membrane protein
MSSRSIRAVAFVLVLLFASMSPLAIPAQAHQSIILSTDTSHVVLMPGSAGNVTLTIENNATAIETFNVSVDSAGLSNLWNISASEDTVENVFPTWSKNTTIIVRLAEGAVPADSGSFDIHVTEPDQNFTSVITIYVSVAPSYLPILNLASMGGPLVSMDSGTNTTFTIDVENLGSVEDTLLLDVEYEPDLAAWWANYTNGSSNNSGNNTGNNTGGNGSGNNTGGNNTGGNGTGGNGSGSGGNNTTIISNVLMFGNSYTSFNSLHSIVEALGISNADALTGGGKTLAGHWSDVNSSHVSNTTLRNANIDWDYVILQDQSQIPGFNRTNADWIASKDAAVNLADVIGDEGGESILMMTWGRRNGDAMNPTLYSNFSVMQDRLESGYMDYHSNITNAGHTVWMAPVGLAFAHIHDNVVAAGFNASVTGNTFYDLYNADGSHPSLAGSYLAACVLYATMTGETPVGSNDTVALSSSLKLELQQAAAATVFNETSHLTYPWQSTTTTASMSLMSSRGLGGGIPNGWSVQWVDDQFTNMPAGSSSTANLHVSVPSNAAPDYYGFRLFSASTGGNVSTSTLLVVQVDEEHNLSIVFLDQSSAFIPGLSTDTEIQVTNTGNAQVDYNWALELIDGPCTASLATASTPGLSPNDVANIQFQITVHEEATKTDDCDLKLDATGDSTSQQHSITPYSFTIDIDELVAFELVAPMSSLEVTPGSPISYEMRILNNGSETVNFYLDVMTPSELETAFVSSSSVEVAPGGVGVWTLTTDGVSGNQGIFSQLFSVSYLGQTSHSSLAIDVLGVEQVALTGPLDGRIQTRPSDSVTTSFTLSNTGTSDLELYGSLLGLPAGADATLSHTSLMLSVGQNIEVNLTISTQSSVAAGSYQISFAYFSSNTSVESIIILQVQERYSVTLNPMFLLPNEEIPVGPNSSSGVMFDMINTGSTQDTLLVSVVDYDDAFDWFEFEIFATTVTLDSGLSTYNTVSFREHTTGAPAGGLSIGIIVKSATDSEVMDHINITLIPFTPGADLQVLSDDDSAEPGGVIHGTVVVTNTGNAIDTLQITTVGIDCGMTATHQLLPGQSSPSIPWSCTLPADADAGLKELKFRATSSARPSFSTLSSEIYTVEPVWGSSGVIEITFDENELSIPSSGGSSVMVSVSNLANAQVTGSLNIEGVGDGLVALEWIRLLDNTSTNLFTLTPGSSIQYKLSLNSLVSTSEDASLSVRATYVIDETTQSDVSSSLNIDIVGPEQPPNGVQLPFDVQLSQSDSLNAMFGGWLFSFLILGVLYLRRSKKEIPLMDDEVDSDTEEEETVEEESTLGYNECRMEGDKVSCPSCEARLGVPRGSDPPFRFTCPKCSTLIRVVD